MIMKKRRGWIQHQSQGNDRHVWIMEYYSHIIVGRFIVTCEYNVNDDDSRQTTTWMGTWVFSATITICPILRRINCYCSIITYRSHQFLPLIVVGHDTIFREIHWIYKQKIQFQILFYSHILCSFRGFTPWFKKTPSVVCQYNVTHRGTSNK